MKSNQGGVKLSLVVVSIIVLGVFAWFNQASADQLPQSSSESIQTSQGE